MTRAGGYHVEHKQFFQFDQSLFFSVIFMEGDCAWSESYKQSMCLGKSSFGSAERRAGRSNA